MNPIIKAANVLAAIWIIAKQPPLGNFGILAFMIPVGYAVAFFCLWVAFGGRDTGGCE